MLALETVRLEAYSSAQTRAPMRGAANSWRLYSAAASVQAARGAHEGTCLNAEGSTRHMHSRRSGRKLLLAARTKLVWGNRFSESVFSTNYTFFFSFLPAGSGSDARRGRGTPLPGGGGARRGRAGRRETAVRRPPDARPARALPLLVLRTLSPSSYQ